MSTLPYAILFQIFSAMLLPNIIWIGLQLGKLSQKWKGWTFHWDTVHKPTQFVGWRRDGKQ